MPVSPPPAPSSIDVSGLPSSDHVDDRLVAQQDAVRPDLDGIISRVHKVIEVLDPPGRQGPQRNRHLGVMRRRRRHDAADGDPAIGGYRRAACTRSRMWYGPWRCAWCRHRRPSAGPPASAEGSSSVAVPAGSAPSPAPLPCERPPPLAPLRLAAFGFGAGFSRASIAVASREMCSTRWPSIVRAISVSCRRLARRLSANSEKARYRHLLGSRRHMAPAAAGIACRQPQMLRLGSGRRSNVRTRSLPTAPAT